MTRFGVVFTPSAEAQLGRLFDYIAAHSGAARADRYVGAIVSAVAL